MKTTRYFGDKVINGINGTGPKTYQWDGGLNTLAKLCRYADKSCNGHQWNGTRLVRFNHEAPFSLDDIAVDSETHYLAQHGLKGMVVDDGKEKRLIFFYGNEPVTKDGRLNGRIVGKVNLPENMPAAMQYGRECTVVRYC